jgi:hypothetical protein
VHDIADVAQEQLVSSQDAVLELLWQALLLARVDEGNDPEKTELVMVNLLLLRLPPPRMPMSAVLLEKTHESMAIPNVF